MRHWLRQASVFDSLKNTMAVYRSLGREKRICCEGGIEGVVFTRSAIATKGPSGEKFP